MERKVKAFSCRPLLLLLLLFCFIFFFFFFSLHLSCLLQALYPSMLGAVVGLFLRAEECLQILHNANTGIWKVPGGAPPSSLEAALSLISPGTGNCQNTTFTNTTWCFSSFHIFQRPLNIVWVLNESRIFDVLSTYKYQNHGVKVIKHSGRISWAHWSFK